ncbi:SCP-like extracellular protein [Geotalea daltonii FRC-32]|uniref:SCP-like extracellular protein n=1 Tax=Geotalea daltonii (strain DSM 22248 / JCM 15807 / FRC-32) TaxID=316067 RepID=B9M3E7_GEODF|nr:CAP domain-containing protein [Geotalea daltonii]ACM21368.1 SCP-like extracellular protein [Geotalea daltonii FRC-32]
MIAKLMSYLLIATALFAAVPAHGAPDPHAVHLELNLARTNPKGYAEYLEQFRRKFRGKAYRLEDKRTRVVTQEGVKAVDEAIRFLSRTKPLPPLKWSDGMASAASELVKEQGETGRTGHNAKSGNMTERIERQGRWLGKIGENIGYGPTEARLMVMQLIIDDGVLDRGHRKNIFDRKFNVVGVACGEHPVFRSMCAMDFAGSFAE